VVRSMCMRHQAELRQAMSELQSGKFIHHSKTQRVEGAVKS